MPSLKQQLQESREFREFLAHELKDAPEWGVALFLKMGELQSSHHLTAAKQSEDLQRLRVDLFERLAIQDAAIQANQIAIQTNQQTIARLEGEVGGLAKAIAPDVTREIEQDRWRRFFASVDWFRTTVAVGILGVAFAYLGAQVKSCSAPTPKASTPTLPMVRERGQQ